MVTGAQQAPTFAPLSFNQIARGQRVDATVFYEPLPPEIVALLDAKQVKAHRALCERTTKAIADVAAAAAQLDAAGAQDRRALVDAAAAGKPPAKPTVPHAKLELERAEEIRQAHLQALSESANELLAAAAPKIPAATDQVAAAVAGERARQQQLLAEAQQAGTRARELEHELDWLRRTAGSARAKTYRPGATHPSALDNGIRTALADGERELERRAEERDRLQREREFLAEQERRAEQVAQSSSRARVAAGERPE